MKALVTGANGFVGRAVWQRLNAIRGVQAVGSVRWVNSPTTDQLLILVRALARAVARADHERSLVDWRKEPRKRILKPKAD